MNEGTQNYTPEQMESELSKIGSSISFYADEDATYISVNTQKKHLDKTIALLEERLLRPKFTPEDFKRNQKQIAQSILSDQTDAGELADMAFSKILYGSKTIMSEPVSGTFKTVKAFTLKDVQAFYDKFYTPELTNLVVVGDVAQSEIMPKLAFLTKWQAKNTQLPNLILNAPPAQPTQIRINLNLREDKGITYGIYGGFGGDETSGTFEVGAGVRRSASDTAIIEIFKEMNNYRNNGITDEELEFSKKSLRSGEALRYETPGQKARLLSTIATKSLPMDYIEQQNKVISSLTKEEINQLAKEMLDTEKMVIVVVGDKEKIIDQLKKLGYKVVDYKLEGISNSSW